MNEHTKTWSLQDAKARLSEVVRLAQTEGPQQITVHGKHVVTLYPAVSDNPLPGRLTGQALIDAMQACPYREEFPLVVPGEPMPVNDPLNV